MLLSDKKTTRKKRKPEISPTKLRTYLTCPLMYKHIYVTKIARFHYSPNAGDTFGGSLHRALHDFYSSGGHETHTPDELVERLKSTWVATGYVSRDDESQHLDAGVRILQEYYENSQNGAKTIFTEKQLREDMGDFVLVGRIDRLDEHPDGTIEIIDYKSGRASTSEEEVAGDLAMSIYQLLGKKKYPDRRVIATIHCLRTGVAASAELSAQELEELEEMIRAVAQDMLAIDEDTEIDPERIPACDRCNFLSICTRRAKQLGIDW